MSRSRCIWAMCGQLKWHRIPGMELCQEHALQVWSQVTADIEGGETQAPAKPKVKREPSDSGCVYYLKIGDRIKVGYASNLRNRMRSYPPHSELLAVEAGTIQDEQRIHAELTAHRVAGREWYGTGPEMLAYVAAVIEREGNPADFGCNDLMIKGKPKPPIRARSSAGGINRRGQKLGRPPMDPREFLGWLK